MRVYRIAHAYIPSACVNSFKSPYLINAQTKPLISFSSVSLAGCLVSISRSFIVLFRRGLKMGGEPGLRECFGLSGWIKIIESCLVFTCLMLHRMGNSGSQIFYAATDQTLDSEVKKILDSKSSLRRNNSESRFVRI